MLHIPASLQIDGLYSCFSGVCQAGNKSRARYCSLPGRVGKRWWRAALCMPRCSAQKQQCHGSPGGSTAVPRSLQSACEVQISSQDTLCPPASDFQPCLKFCALSPALQELRTDCSSQADKSPLLAYLCLLLQRVGGEVLPHSHLTPSIAGMSPPRGSGAVSSPLSSPVPVQLPVSPPPVLRRRLAALLSLLLAGILAAWPSKLTKGTETDQKQLCI